MTRYMGQVIKGQFATIMSVTQVASVLMNFGIYHLYPQMVREQLENARQKFIDIFFFQAFIYCIIAALVFFITRSTLIGFYFLVAIVSSFTAQLTMVCMVEYPIFRSKSLLYTSIISTVASIVIYASNIDRMLVVPIALALFKDVIFCVLVLIKLRVRPHIFNVNFKLMLELCKKGIIPMLTALLLKLNYKVDIFMLNIFNVEDSSIGIYAVSVSLATQTWIIPEAFKEVLYSRASKKNAVKSFLFSIKVSTYMLIAVTITFAFLGKYAILLLYGSEFVASYTTLIILLIGAPFMGIFNVINPYYLSMGKYTTHILNLLVGVIANIVLNFILISQFGIIGAAIATSASQIICGLFAIEQF